VLNGRKKDGKRRKEKGETKRERQKNNKVRFSGIPGQGGGNGTGKRPTFLDIQGSIYPHRFLKALRN
jgi:hypothetical protein